MKTLPALGNEFQSSCSCKICGSKAFAFDTVDFNKYCSHDEFYSYGFSGVRVDYHRCSLCGAIFTLFFDNWSKQEFENNVYNDDYIKVDSEYASVRPRFVAKDMVERWGDCFDAKVLDYGSGAGVFADELRKRGYRNVEAFDPFSSPQLPTGTFDIVTCFEVIEHATSPADTLARMCQFLKEDGCIIVSQTLQPPEIMRIRGAWWYLGPRNGHICTFTANSLAYLASSQELTFFNGSGNGPHAFARPNVSSYAVKALATIGRAHYFLPLFAPEDLVFSGVNGETPWYPKEVGKQGTFRWMGARNIVWPAPSMSHFPATVSVKLPYIDSMTKELVDGLIINAGCADIACDVDAHSITTEFCTLYPIEHIALRSSQLVTPRSLRGDDDDRLLGIAVPVRPN